MIYKINRLDKHAARAAAGVVHPAFERFEHLHKSPDDAGGGVELACPPPFLFGKFAEAILIGPAQNILIGAVLYHSNIGEEIDDGSQAAFIELIAGIVFGEDTFEGFVFFFDGPHGSIDNAANIVMLLPAVIIGDASGFKSRL